MFLDLASGGSIIKAGKVRPLAIGSKARSPLLPNVPTLAELGVPDAEVFAFQGLLGPAGLPQDVVARLNLALNAALTSPAVVKRFTDFGFEPLLGSPEAFNTLARAEAARWARSSAPTTSRSIETAGGQSTMKPPGPLWPSSSRAHCVAWSRVATARNGRPKARVISRCAGAACPASRRCFPPR